MFFRPALILALSFVVATTTPAIAQTSGSPTTASPSSTSSASVNGIRLHYEIHGTGQPLVLLHGGVNPSEMFGAPLAELARTHRVIAIHLEGHGLTGDSGRPWRYETMADDVAALMAHLEIEKASVMGYSFGGLVALQTAIRHPEMIDRLVVVSAPIRSDDNYPEVTAAFDQMPANAAMIASHVGQSPLATLYPDIDWETTFTKLGHLNGAPRDWSSDVSRIRAPTLLIYADADMMRPEGMAAAYKLIGGGQRDAGVDGTGRSPNRLAIIPGTTHYNMLGSSAVTTFALDFIAQ